MCEEGHYIDVGMAWHLTRRAVLLALTFMISLLVSTAAAQSSALEIKGTITGRMYGEGSKLLSKGTDWFTATVSPGKNRVRTGPMGNAALDYMEYGEMESGSYMLLMNNTNFTVTEYQEFENGVARTIKLTNPVKPANDAMIFLKDGVIPEHGWGMITPAWLAFCSGSAFDTKDGNPASCEPIFSLGTGVQYIPAMTGVEFTLSKAPPFFLSNLSERVSMEAYKKLGLAATFKDKFTAVTYEVVAWTNFGNLVIPQRFKTFVFRPNSSLNLPRSEEYEGIVSGIASNVTIPNALKIPLVTRVVEQRTGYGPATLDHAYTTTDGNIRSKEALLAYDSRVAQPRLKKLAAQAWKGRLGVYIALSVVCVAPLIVIYHNLRKKRREH